MTDEVTKTIVERDSVRTAQEIATRALALFAVVGMGFDAGREEVTTWLHEEDLYEALTPTEKRFVANETPTRRELINASWQSEALLLLLWALEKVEDLPPANIQCGTSLFKRLLPPYADISVKDFVRLATRRSDEALRNMADVTMNLHAKAPSQDVDVEIVRERHRAINWVVGYEGLPWDEVTADT